MRVRGSANGIREVRIDRRGAPTGADRRVVDAEMASRPNHRCRRVQSGALHPAVQRWPSASRPDRRVEAHRVRLRRRRIWSPRRDQGSGRAGRSDQHGGPRPAEGQELPPPDQAGHHDLLVLSSATHVCVSLHSVRVTPSEFSAFVLMRPSMRRSCCRASLTTDAMKPGGGRRAAVRDRRLGRNGLLTVASIEYVTVPPPAKVTDRLLVTTGSASSSRSTARTG